jgi:hypothetical protein
MHGPIEGSKSRVYKQPKKPISNPLEPSYNYDGRTDWSVEGSSPGRSVRARKDAHNPLDPNYSFDGTTYGKIAGAAPRVHIRLDKSPRDIMNTSDIEGAQASLPISKVKHKGKGIDWNYAETPEKIIRRRGVADINKSFDATDASAAGYRSKFQIDISPLR